MQLEWICPIPAYVAASLFSRKIIVTSDNGSEESFGDIEDRNAVRIIVGKTQETGIPTLKI